MLPVFIFIILYQRSSDNCHRVYFDRIAAAREVIDRRIQSEKNRSICLEITHSLGNLVTHVSRTEIREDEGVGVACNFRIRTFCTGYTRGYSSVELQLAFDWRRWILRFCFDCCISHFFHIWSFAGAECGVA